MNVRDSKLGIARATWPACVTTLAVLAGAGVLFSAGFAFAAEPSASVEAKAAKKKKKGKAKDRPCANKNKRWILCKPRAGLYLGQATQDTPSGPLSKPLQFEVEVSKRKNSASVRRPTFVLRAWTGDTPSDTYYVAKWVPSPPPIPGQWLPVPSYECPTCDPWGQFLSGFYEAFVHKTHGGFYGSDKQGDSQTYMLFNGDFLSKTRAKGTIDSVGYPTGYSIRTVTWKASWARKPLPDVDELPCPFPLNPELCP